ncbi:MAG: MFS transporter [Erysipelotrichaceae bacterium]|nr:MFS transporter [Erysipelotrichaceae bacterium]
MFDQYRGLRRELYVLFIGRIMTNLGSMVWPMLTLILTKKLGMNASEAADCLLVFSVLAIPVSLLGGKLADRYNKRNIIIVCDIVSVCAYITCGIIPLTFYSVILMAVAALFQSIEWPSYDALVADLTLPKDRQRAYSLSYLGSNLGLMLTPTIGGILFNRHLDLAFIINGIAILSSTVLIYFLIRNVDREQSVDDVNEYENDLKDGTSALRLLFSSRTILVYTLAAILYETAYHQYSFLMPMDMAVQYGEYGSVLYGTLSSVNCLCVVVLTSFLTRLLSGVRETRKFTAGICCVLAGLLIFRVLIAYPGFIYTAIVVFTVGEIIYTLGASPFLSRRVAANYRGRIRSITMAVSNIIVSLFTKFIGIVYDASVSGAWTLTYLIAVIGILISFYTAYLDRKEYPSLYK